MVWCDGVVLLLKQLQFLKTLQDTGSVGDKISGSAGGQVVIQIALSLGFTTGCTRVLLLIKIGEWQMYRGDGGTDGSCTT